MTCYDKEVIINILTLLASTAAISSNLGRVSAFTGATLDFATMIATWSPAKR